MKIRVMLLLMVFCSACRQELPAGVLPPEKMEKVLYDYLSADVYVYEYLSRDSSVSEEAESARLQQQVFEKHKISREDFYRSYRYYIQHPEQMRAVIDSLVTKKPEKSKRSKKLKPLKVYDQSL